MTDQQTLPYGLWPSPLSPKGMAGGTRLSDVAWDSDGQTLVWLEGRGDQGVLVAQTGTDAPRDLTTDLAVRARVGYGGGDFGVAGGYVYFAESTSGRLYRQALAGGSASPITPGFGHAASPTISPDGRWVVYVHSYERVDRLAIVDVAGKRWPQQIAGGADFAMQPRWHPSGTMLAWVEWHHPQMPWDGTELRLATVQPPSEPDGLPTLTDIHTVAGNAATAIFQPEFSPDGKSLVYISNATGWENLYAYDLASGTHNALTEEQADLGEPAWSQGQRAYAFAADGRSLLFLRDEGGFRRLCRYDLASDTAAPAPLLPDYTWIARPAVAPTGGRLAAIASSSAIPPRIVSVAPGDPAPRIHARSAAESLLPGDIAIPRPVTWNAGEGATAYGLYYPPTSCRYRGTGLPPAIVHVHGGPTGSADSSYNANAQFFTTRGYAYLEVNHRGSTGHGRDYTRALREQWGVADVEDTVAAARYLADAGLADGARLTIMGGSAGGYTVLQTLVTHPGTFKAALCLYGISNLFTLAADTHKFEERYLDSLIGPLPETHARYRERSPLFHADRIADAVAIFQGEIDPVVPRAQADEIVAILRRHNVPHEYHVYEGEGHGWRKRETTAAFRATVERFLKEYVLFA